MNNKSVLFVAFTVLVTISGCSTKTKDPITKDIPVDKLKKNCEKINKYLEKSVQTDDVKINMAKVDELFDEKSTKCFNLGGKSFVDTLSLLRDFATVPSNEETCQQSERSKLMGWIDNGLYDASRLQEPNYALTRLDRIIEHYAFENVFSCKFNGGVKNWPVMVYGFKQSAYDQINVRLLDMEPETDDAETNMAKAEQILEGLEPQNGALADALKQLLTLKSILSEDTCNDQGYKILLKNDLATRGRAHNVLSEDLRRVDKIYRHYAIEHEQLCRPVVRKLFGTALKKLDMDTYRRVLGLTSSHFLSVDKFDMMAKQLYQKQVVDEDFTIPLLADWAVKNCRYDRRLPQIREMNSYHIYYYMAAMNAIEKDSKRVFPHEGKEVMESISKHLIEPCIRYLSIFEPLVDADEYGAHMNFEHNKTGADKFADDLTYHVVRAGHQACKWVTTYQKDLFDILKEFGKKFSDDNIAGFNLLGFMHRY